MKPALLALVLGGCAGLAACRSTPEPVPNLAHARHVEDFRTYRIERVGLLPFRGAALEASYADVLQQAFHAELVNATPYELVRLLPADLEEVPGSDPHRRGGYDPRTILDVSRRFRLDGMLVPTVTDFQYFPPLRLGVQLELVSSETGALLWTSLVHLDTSDATVRRGLEAFHRRRADSLGDERWQLTLLAPRRLARFAAWQVAGVL